MIITNDTNIVDAAFFAFFAAITNLITSEMSFSIALLAQRRGAEAGLEAEDTVKVLMLLTQQAIDDLAVRWPNAKPLRIAFEIRKRLTPEVFARAAAIRAKM